MPSTKAGHFTAQDIPDLNGYVAVVTGGNSGIGYETCLQLAINGVRVYIASRSLERISKAIDDMKKSKPKKTLDLRPLHIDMQSLKSVKLAAEEFLSKERRLDLLINNAGIMAVPYKLTPDGFETQWQTNHLAPFLFVNTLLPILKSTATASTSKTRVRIVNVSSDAAFLSAPKELDLDRPNLDYVSGTMAAWKRYGHSKVASLLHARALNTRLAPLGITAYALNPGIVPTNLQAADPTFVGTMIRFLVGHRILPGVVSVEEGARTTLFCAVSPEAVGGAGGFFVQGGKVDKRGERWVGGEEPLWEGSERMVREAGF